jgi:hypothetical protein
MVWKNMKHEGFVKIILMICLMTVSVTSDLIFYGFHSDKLSAVVIDGLNFDLALVRRSAGS